ncbi:MAG: hypothetical protein CL927_10930 [Deltaproteobacteria bacterium]|nr:hypothetical protein [Deltaproteobacteria bacterium]HCH61249.1 hypothetical protein [Deltaproteobacteria bacterium]
MRSWTMWALGLSLVITAACSGGDKGGGSEGDSGAAGGDGGDGGGPATFEDFINTTASPVGDFTGFEGGFDAAGGWLTQPSPDASCVVERPVNALVEDFETEEGVGEATVEIWFADEVSGVPDVTMTSDFSGNLSGGNTLVCQPITYKASTDPDLDDTKSTFEAHMVSAYTDSSVGENYNSVSKTTYQLIPSILGISPDPAKGTAAGTVFDMNGDPVTGAQVVVSNDAGNLSGNTVVKYFVENFPTRDQPETSEDGLWVAVNIPPGEWNIDAYVSDGAGSHILMGRTRVTIYADSINIGNISVGYDSVKFPDNCLAPCGG